MIAFRRGAARTTVAVLAALGVLLLCASTAVELLDAEPQAELWIGAAAGAAFLLAVPFSRGGDAEVLTVRARLLVGAGLSALLAVVGLWQATERSSNRVLLLLAPVSLLFITAGLALREAGVSGRQARLRELRSRLDGEETERRRWVRELHDDTLQDLAAVDVLLATAAASGEEDTLASGVADARAMIAAQVRTLRRLISRMRPLVLDTLGLAAAVEDLARRTEDTSGIKVRAEVADMPRLPAEAETAVYRIIQAALANAVRHAGASMITITGHRRGSWLDVEVHDDGRGAPMGGYAPGYGLLGMRERAETLQARLVITGGDPAGTVVRLEVPLAGIPPR